MSAINTIEKILKTKLVHEDLRYCLVDARKRPFTIDNEMAAVNNVNDFVKFEDLLSCDSLDIYSGIGISVQASNVSAIDIDKCVRVPFDKAKINSFAKEIIDIFKEIGYVEFSFSGTGIRILFKSDVIEKYSQKYLIKNSKSQLEYYQPGRSNRYVTVTGNYLHNNKLTYDEQNNEIVNSFLEKYMKRTITKQQRVKYTDDTCFEELLKKVRYLNFTNYQFQELWFTHAPGSDSDESERDYRLLRLLYINVTQDRDKIKELFEESEFFKTKDRSHMRKWTQYDYRYFDYMFNHIKEKYV